MMVNLDSVDEETDNELPVKTPNEASAEDGSEEKVRVDRRKLEQMLQVNGHSDGPSAEEFFSKVMLDTSTHISWPSKLKIGAKSKKDPHIKIAGQLENIKKAKEMVAAVLESKANRVTLKMDVSHTDHSHIIGRGGKSIKKVMEETGCHIHFPDSNRGSASTEKSNQVSIAGQPEGVEKARTRIRELLPLVLLFEVPFNSMFLPMEPLTPAIESIAQRYDVTFTLKGRSPIGSLFIVVRGSQDKNQNIQEAMGYLFKHLTGHFQIPSLVSLQFDIAPQHHVFVVGRSGCNVKHITDSTGAKIEFPADPSVNSRKGTVSISGSFNVVIQARTLLVNSLPMLLMFDIKEEEASSLESGAGKLMKLMNKFDVTIQVKPKPKQTSKSVVIKSRESNSQNMYLTRLEILGNPMDPKTTQHPPFSSLQRHSPEPSPFSPLTNAVNWYPHVGQSPIHSPGLTPMHSPTPTHSKIESPVTVRTTTSPQRIPPGFEFPPGFDRDFPRDRAFSDISAASADSDSILSPGTAFSEGDSRQQFGDNCSYPEPTPIGESCPGRPTSQQTDLSNSGNFKYAILEGTKNAKGIQHLLDSHGSTSPFSSLGSSFSFKFAQQLNLMPQKKFIDYDEQRGKANEIMTKKVVQPQVRTPTDQWSGYHLSKSTDAFRIPMVKGLLPDPHSITPCTEELPEPGEAPAVRQDLSKSVKINPHLHTKGATNPFYKQRNEKFVESYDLQKTLKVNLYDLLKTYGVENFSETLERQEIDFDTFLTLTKEDLKEAGVEPLGARKKMEHAIRDMKQVQEEAIENNYFNRASQNFRIGNPLDFNSQSGRW